MSLRDLSLKRVYRSYGEDSISDMINPLLSHAISYKRSVGFFSSSSLKITAEGINQLIKNRRHAGLKSDESCIQFIASPMISADDKAAIELGYKNREEVIKKSFIDSFEKTLEFLDDDTLSLLADLISAGIVDIKIAKAKGLGDYHDKFALVEDFNHDIIAFNGSSNESENGLKDNYERIFLFNSWEESGKPYVDDDIEEFDTLWNGTNEYNDVYSFKDAIVLSVLKIRKNRKTATKELKPYDYQNEAINAWKNNGYKGFFVMATGTGKTLTSLFALRELMSKEPLFTVIAVPYKHLVAQWSEDVVKVFPNVTLMQT